MVRKATPAVPLSRTPTSGSAAIELFLNHGESKLPAHQAKRARAFIYQYYQRVCADDLYALRPADAFGAAWTHLELGRVRKPGQGLVRVYNPDFEKHGWQCKHTVVEIIADNKPFLVDSVAIAINRAGISTHLTLHPVIAVKRSRSGELQDILVTERESESESVDAVSESYIQVQVDLQSDAAALNALKKELTAVLNEVAAACGDWQAMRKQMHTITDQLQPQINAQTSAEEAALCRWLADDHFTFLGYCEFAVTTGSNVLSLKTTSVLGVLKLKNAKQFAAEILPGSGNDIVHTSGTLLITKTNVRSNVHRPSYMDLLLIKRYADDGAVVGIYCVVGLTTSEAYRLPSLQIPLLRERVDEVIKRSGLLRHGHAVKSLKNIIDDFPRSLLFQASTDELFDNAMGILALQERQRIRLFVIPEKFNRFYTCLVYLPRERYSREQRLVFENILMRELDGASVQFDTLFSESVLARVKYLIHRKPDSRTETLESLKVPEIEYLLIQSAQNWRDELVDALTDLNGEVIGRKLGTRFVDAFPKSYEQDFDPRTGALDVGRINKVLETRELGVRFYQSAGEEQNNFRLKLYSAETSLPPSDVLPILEDMGLRVLEERPYELTISVAGKAPRAVWVHDLHLTSRDDLKIDLDDAAPRCESAFLHVWQQSAESDGFNRLVLAAGLDWREIVIMRAYCKYLRQIRVRFSETYMINTLNTNPHMCRRLIQLFHARLDPNIDNREKSVAKFNEDIQLGLERVDSLDKDRILRAFVNVIESTLRTNFYQTVDGQPKAYLSFKLNPRNINAMPQPRPVFEIFVYSPRLEAVHLRGGKVARGGLRWSDRREDFRTEVLGLVKAQLVKNAVIVPTGSKGGFVVKRMPDGSREEVMAEVIECYKTFIRGMLDITDNIVDEKIVFPKNTVRHDEGDPYLVVAADKGTATFSDIANTVSEEYGFWLGDAFASGGSAGYDHKGMGITARGAWESVKRHFRELGLDTQREDFSVVGIGDMAGDVFGNGMLLSKHIKLVGAFNHLHILVDPDSDPASSFTERQRLFDTPGLSWTDYNKKLISKGGGIYARSAKSISLSKEAKQMLGINTDKLTPNDLINAMLKAPVDLIWNGGIGTYVKSESQSDDEVRDRANDAVRVTGQQLRCRVFGEGGNLGMTQLGRNEYALNGGACYTDSIDNSAGVDTSDHEVNIKVLLDRIMANGDMTGKQRNSLLASMTDEVGELVLSNNYGQTQAISIAANSAKDLLLEHMRLIHELERTGRLQRELENLPSDAELLERQTQNQGLTKPELSILISYSKIALFDDLMQSNVPEAPYLASELASYFPKQLAKKYNEQISAHRLKREIIATHITNNIVNRMGPTFVMRLGETAGTSSTEVVRAYAAARDIFEVESTWAEIEALDNKVPATVQMQMLTFASGLIERASLWLLRSRKLPLDISKTVDYFHDDVQKLLEDLPKTLVAENRLRLKRSAKKLIADGVDKRLAEKMASFIPMSSALDIVEISNESKQKSVTVANIYYELGDKLHFMWLRDNVAELKSESNWHILAKSSLRNQLHQQQRALTLKVLSASRKKTKDGVSQWLEKNSELVEPYKLRLQELHGHSQLDFAMLSVALSAVQTLTR